MYPLKTKRDAGKLKWQYQVRDMPEKRLPAIADRAVWDRTTKAGIRWDNVVEKIWKGLGGDQEDISSIEKFGGYKKKQKKS